MPPILPAHAPKVVVYFQTHHTGEAQKPVSVLPLLGHGAGAQPSATHVIVAAIHVNEDPSRLTLNDHPPDHPRFDVLWSEVAALQTRGVRVLGMLGGAAKGTFARLDTGAGVPPAAFEAYYGPLAALVRARRLDGLDLDVEEPMTLAGIVHLIDRLRRDFGPRFLLTLAPVAAALLRPDDPRCNLSGFSYRDLERARGRDIAWYHAQFYCGWGDASQPHMYAAMTGPPPSTPPQSQQQQPTSRFTLSNLSSLFSLPTSPLPSPFLPPHRVVMGLVTNPKNGAGFVPLETTAQVVMQLQAVSAVNPGFPGSGSGFAGVSGWEYFNSLPGGEARPWEWAEWMSAILGARVDADGQAGYLQSEPAAAAAAAVVSSQQQQQQEQKTLVEADPDDAGGPDVPVPSAFEYYESGLED